MNRRNLFTSLLIPFILVLFLIFFELSTNLVNTFDSKPTIVQTATDIINTPNDNIITTDIDKEVKEVIIQENKPTNEEIKKESTNDDIQLIQENINETNNEKEVTNSQINNNDIITSEKKETKYEKKVSIIFSQDTSVITNKDITFTIDTLETDLISFNNSDYALNKTYKVSENGNYIIKIKEGNQISIGSITITNIDKVKPTLKYTKSTIESAESVTITLTSSDDRSLPTNMYSYNNGPFTNITTHTFNHNVSDFSIRVIDSAGNITEQFVTIDNINESSVVLKNKQLIAEIKNVYGFDIEYGEETYFWYNGLSSTILTDEDKANTALNDLKSKLNLFPEGFFYMFQGKNGYSVLLVDDIPGDVAGIATSEMPGNNQLVLDVNAGFLGRTFYHETFHLIDYMLDYMYYESSAHPFKDWNTLNDSTFTYSGSDSDDNSLTIYDSSVSNMEKRFITSYAKKSEREDRAELFADLMFRPYKHFYMNEEYGVYQKAKYLVSVLNNIWTNNSGAGWNRWIN